MTTLQQNWQEYFEAAYGGQEIPAVQQRECHQAFMAGAMSACALMRQIGELPEEEAVKALDAFFKEATLQCGLHAFAMKFKN